MKVLRVIKITTPHSGSPVLLHYNNSPRIIQILFLTRFNNICSRCLRAIMRIFKRQPSLLLEQFLIKTAAMRPLKFI
jgi:hypothetical protein